MIEKKVNVDSSIDLQKIIDSIGNTPSKLTFETDAIEINSRLRVYNNTEWACNGCTFTLMENVPLATFPVQIPLIAPKDPSKAENIIIHDAKFYGNRNNQKYVPGWNGHSGKESTKQAGQGYHNFIMLGLLNNVKYSNSNNCSFYNLEFYDNLGDGIRAEGSSNLKISNIKGSNGGHDVICCASVLNCEVSNVEVDLSVNAAVRFRSVTNGSIHDCKITGTNKGYCPGIQVQSTAANWACKNVTIYDNHITDTLGPGIWVAGSVSGNDITIKNNLFERCGQMPAANKIPGVGAIVTDGFDATIQNNTIVNSYGYGVLVGYYLLKSSVKGNVTISKNIITGTRKSLYQASTDSGVANLTDGRYYVSCTENCMFENVNNFYNVFQRDNLTADPLFTEDYHLKAESPCKVYGCYTEEDPQTLFISCTEDEANLIIKSLSNKTIYRSS